VIKKKDFFIIFLLGSVLIIASSVFLFFQFKRHAALSQELKDKESALDQAQEASKKMQQLETQSDKLRETEKTLEQEVAISEDKPLSLVRAMFMDGVDLGLENVTFDLNAKSALELPAFAVPSGLAPTFLQMSFQADYSRLLYLLQRLKRQPRIVSIEKITIERKEALLPLQSVSLNLEAYGFSSGDRKQEK
jgi:Tfp pilus assembly protein PilO